MSHQSRPVRRALRWPLALVPPRAVVPILSGPARGCWWRVGAGVHGYWLGLYESKVAKLFASLITPRATVWDVGAHAGYFTLIAAKRGAAVHAFEPAPDNARELRRHVALNRCADRVTVHQAAAGRFSGEAWLEPGPDTSQWRLGASGVRVRSVALDEAGAPAPTLVKMDVEGAEADALVGMARTLRTAAPTLVLAVHYTASRCAGLLKDAGYRVTPIDGSTWLAAPARQERTGA